MLPSIKKYVNLKCVPSDPNWPSTREIHTPDFGGFLPNEVKRVDHSPRLQRVLATGEFEVTEEDPNSEEIRLAASQKKVTGEESDQIQDTSDENDEEENDEEENDEEPVP